MSKLIKILHAFHKNMIHILVYTTGVCNYSCKYCSFGMMKNTKFMKLNDLYKFLVKLYNIRKQDIYIELIGGEPTLDNDILDFSKKIYNNFKEHITIGIYTNFSRSFELYYNLAKYCVDLTITWHSINNIENNSFIDKVNRLLSLSINKNIDIHVMYEKNNIKESIRVFNILVEKYPYNVELCLLDRDFETDKIYFLENTYYSKDELFNYNNLIQKLKYGENKRIYKATYDNNQEKILTVQEILNKSDSYNFKHWICEAGKNYMYIDTTGNIYPCFCYCEEKNGIIGNIYNINNIVFKNVICKYSHCPCVWEALKYNIFKK